MNLSLPLKVGIGLAALSVLTAIGVRWKTQSELNAIAVSNSPAELCVQTDLWLVGPNGVAKQTFMRHREGRDLGNACEDKAVRALVPEGSVMQCVDDGGCVIAPMIPQVPNYPPKREALPTVAPAEPVWTA